MLYSGNVEKGGKDQGEKESCQATEIILAA